MVQVYNIQCLLMSCGPNKVTLIPRRIYQAAFVLLCVFVFVFQSGCASLNPKPPKTDYQAKLGKVAVVAGTQQPEITFEGFAHNKGEGASKGAWDTFRPCVDMLGHGSCSGDFCGAFVILWLGVCGVSSAVGGAVGAAAAPSAEEAKSAHANMSTALDVTTIHKTLRDQIASAAIANGVNLVSISPQEARDTSRMRDYRSLASAGVDTVLETTLAKAGTRGYGINDPVQAYMQAHIRLIRTCDNSEVFSGDYSYFGERLKLSDWSANQAQRLRRSLNTGYERLGSHICDSVFLLYPFPDWGPHSSGGLLSVAFGLAPIRPGTRGQLTDDSIVSNALDWTTIDTLRPTLRWQSFPRQTDVRLQPEEMGRVINVRYDLIIASEYNLAPFEVVYRREGLTDSAHKVQMPLRSATHYFWTVRARFQLDGRQRVTEWSSTDYMVRDRFTAPTNKSYRFKTP